MKVRTIKESRESPPSQEFAIKTNQVHLRKKGRKKKSLQCQGDNSYLSASTIVTEAQIAGRILNRSQWRWILPGQGTLGTELSATT